MQFVLYVPSGARYSSRLESAGTHLEAQVNGGVSSDDGGEVLSIEEAARLVADFVGRHCIDRPLLAFPSTSIHIQGSDDDKAYVVFPAGSWPTIKVVP